MGHCSASANLNKRSIKSIISHLMRLATVVQSIQPNHISFYGHFCTFAQPVLRLVYEQRTQFYCSQRLCGRMPKGECRMNVTHFDIACQVRFKHRGFFKVERPKIFKVLVWFCCERMLAQFQRIHGHFFTYVQMIQSTLLEIGWIQPGDFQETYFSCAIFIGFGQLNMCLLLREWRFGWYFGIFWNFWIFLNILIIFEYFGIFWIFLNFLNILEFLEYFGIFWIY